jgi:hypothetical protein
MDINELVEAARELARETRKLSMPGWRDAGHELPGAGWYLVADVEGQVSVAFYPGFAAGLTWCVLGAGAVRWWMCIPPVPETGADHGKA